MPKSKPKQIKQQQQQQQPPPKKQTNKQTKLH
jgi:hypothetical protein